MKPRKKAVYIAANKALKLSREITWHASTVTEANDIRVVFGHTTRILIRENETSLPEQADPPAFERSDHLKVVFLSRISEKKGLDILLDALKQTKDAIVLDIYGPKEHARYYRRCYELSQMVPENVKITFRGSARPENVRSVLSRYDIMVLPTAGENFGHVVAEALSVSCPVMCTDQTPWTQRLRAGGGMVVTSRTAYAWSEAIRTYARLTAAERHQRRLDAGLSYNQWHAEYKGPHVLDLLRAHFLA
jgi:glycosyltransferase involved in cell wall biosynthesis